MPTLLLQTRRISPRNAMETATTSAAWIKPGARLFLFAVGRGVLHYAKPGEALALCGQSVSGLFSRGVVVAVSVFIQSRGSVESRRLKAKTDCIKCMEQYCKAMRTPTA